MESTYEKVKLAIGETVAKDNNDMEAFNRIESWMLKTARNEV